MQATVWENDFTLFEHALKVNPKSFISENNLGNAYRLADNPQAAIDHFQRAIAIKPDYLLAWLNLEYEYSSQGMTDELIPVMERTIALRAQHPLEYPNYPQDHLNLAGILIARGQYDDGIAHLRALLQLQPDNLDARNLLDAAEQKRGKRSATGPSTSQP